MGNEIETISYFPTCKVSRKKHIETRDISTGKLITFECDEHINGKCKIFEGGCIRTYTIYQKKFLEH